MSFVKRKIALTFKLGQGQTFAESHTDTVKLSGLKVQAHVEQIAGPGTGTAQIRISGLTPSLMNRLSALNQASMVSRANQVTLQAGDDESGLSTVFQGQITVGQQELNGAPDTSLLVIANAGAYAAVKTTPPLSYQGGADAAVIMANIAQSLGWNFQNYGVSVQLATPYFAGSPLDQIRACAKAAKIMVHVDSGTEQAASQTLVIWPRDGQRGKLIPLISPETGLVGYPSYATGTTGLDVRCIFNPLLTIGGHVKIQSSLTVANGEWQVFQISHDIESETPGGQWFTRFNATNADYINR